MDIILYIIILVLLIFGIILIIISELNKESVKCPPQKIIYQQVPENILDIQFSKENTPSNIYLDMFNKSSPWIGGFTIGNKAYVSDKKTIEIKD
jgi:hypothetical protein